MVNLTATAIKRDKTVWSSQGWDEKSPHDRRKGSIVSS
jgi:hypothetical protein